MEEAREIRRIAGDSFTEAQAVAVARSLRGLARGQRRVEQLARSLYQQKDLNPAESKVAADAFVKAVSDKKAVLARILTPVQLERLYQEASYDSAAYWQRRIVGG